MHHTTIFQSYSWYKLQGTGNLPVYYVCISRLLGLFNVLCKHFDIIAVVINYNAPLIKDYETCELCEFNHE